MAGRLSILAYLSVVFTFIFDFIFIGTEFTIQEAEGIAIVFLANILSAVIVFKKNFLKS
jgi:drug/metabolite transporter (DMT)-like permease